MFKKVWFSLIVIALGASLAFAATPAKAELICKPTGYLRDNINLTAAYINPTSVTSPIDATDCNIGVYYDHNYDGTAELQNIEIYGANYFGVLVNGNAGNIQVNIKNSSIHNIGEVPFNGAQHGVAIYYIAMNEHSATGVVDKNTVYNYQKNGITVDGTGANVTVTNNIVTGEGRIDYIAQNGIQFSRGAMGRIAGNEVSGNYYDNCLGPGKSTCEWVAVGILIYDVNPLLFRGIALNASNDVYDNQYNILIVK